MRSRANLAVVAMQDYLELENAEARMNTPSLAEGNWQWRLKKNYKRRSVKEKIAEIATSTHRA
jgi:4-alpha-glucanotransferase